MEHREEHSALGADEIAAFWAAQAEKHGLDPAASWSDWRAIELEIAAISHYVAPGMTILDAGCATGYSTVCFARPDGVRVLGIDYIEKMIDLAEQRRGSMPAEIAARLEFRVGDIRALDGIPEAAFDLVVTTRVLINLGTASEQREAIEALGQRVRPGGLLLLSEATVGGWQRLNALRREWGLPDIGVPSFNLYLEESAIVESAGDDFILENVENFASSYFVATRLLKPILAQAAAHDVDVADPNAEFNRWASLLPAAGDYGTQKLFVLRRR
ncbi:MAG: class I SAM-dependent methyltransferase [Thermoleophilia bacterium]|nr:class I SAM-dependent methyltransferase [Thermoleophilia bacterium]